ncbi:hypothetical protein OS493_026654 [Desmophyllum pertusum]|uniref:HYR domain-containing protein n=1 Tax=Desmophyllum pertusum TaxID=174260 RepID=A0A9X0CDP5_9CNID|nr:hypothetical protein OS493_026654 [Desmophyllum pertusum]
MCKSSLDFVFNPALLYWCDGGQWNAYVIPGQPSSTSLPWPDCSSQVNPPSWFKTSGQYLVGNYFFDGDANADPNVRDAIRTQFIGLMKSPLVPPPFCLINPQCTEENIKLCVGASDIPVLDTEPPVFTDCPKDIMIDDNTVTDYIRINWNRPTATDNSGVPPSVTSNRQSGALFRVPGSHVVSYKAIDAAGNEATCTFRITLKRKTCPLYAPPKNGALACLDNNGENSYCVPMCPSSLDFVFDPAYLYYCIGAQWNFYIFPGQVPSSSLPWPDCSNQASPSQIKTSGFKSMYFDGDARDPSVQDAIKTKFVEFLKAPYFPPPFCLFRPECTEANVKVYAGALA